MTDPTGARRTPRRKWAWWERLLYWLYGFFVGPFLTRHEDGRVTGAMTRWAVAFFTGAMFYRLVSDPGRSLGWADAFTVFFILFALPIDGAMTRLAKRDPGRLVDAVAGMFGRGSDALHSDAQRFGGPSPGYEMPPGLPVDDDLSFETEDDEP